MTRVSSFATFGLCLMLSGCGGGGGSSGNNNGAGNAPPVFTSALSASVAENTSGTVYTATATGAAGKTLTYSLSGNVSGSDSDLFFINAATGALSFQTAANFEAPRDTNRDNVYNVGVTVNDGTTPVSTTVAITVTDRVGRLSTRRVAQGFSQPLFLTGRGDGSGRVLIVQKGGLVRVLNPATGAIEPQAFLDVSSQVSTAGERGLLGLALAPDFATTGTLYIYLTAPNGDLQVRKFTATATGATGTGDVILSVPHPNFDNHNGGWIGFDRNGLLVIATGDGGGGGDPSGNAQNRNVLLGKILRIDPRNDSFPADSNRDYAIPATNPFAITGGAPEIWHFGLRNPFRSSFDRDTGIFYIADVGQGAVEEISMARPADNGLNFGWNIVEGTRPYAGGSLTGLTPPVAEYPQGTGPLEGRSVTGGYVYRGPVVALRGQYVLGDFINRRIWSLPVTSLVQGATLANTQFTDRTTAFAPAAGAIGNISSFGEDDAANLYVVDFDGEIFMVDDVDE